MSSDETSGMQGYSRVSSVYGRRSLLKGAVAGGFALLTGCLGNGSAPEGPDNAGSNEENSSQNSNGTESSADTVEELKSSAESFVLRLKNEKYERAYDMGSDKFQNSISKNQIKSIWEALLSKHGSFQAVSGKKHDTVEGFNVVIVTVQFESASRGVRIVFNDDQEVAGLQIIEPSSDRIHPIVEAPASLPRRSIEID